MTGCANTKHLPKLSQERKSLPDSLWALPSKSIKPEVFFMVPETYDLAKIPTSDGFKRSRYYDHIKQQIDSIYTLRNFTPIWLNGLRGYKEICEEALLQLQSAYLHGLDPEDYQAAEIRQMLSEVLKTKKIPLERYKTIELTLTAHYLLFNYDLIKGRVNPYKISKYWFYLDKKADVTSSIAELSSSKDLEKHFAAIIPKTDGYQQMTRQLAYYRQIKQNGGWPGISPWSSSYVLEPDSLDPFVPLIRERLKLTEVNILKSAPKDSLRYDAELTSAVKQFQHRHGLEVDGRIGSNTVEFMNISVSEKINQMLLNLERMRWLPSDFGEDFAMVNLPEYKLKVYKNRKVDLEMRVIVGKKTTSTPIFQDTLKYIVFSPTWTVPMSIKSTEMLAKLLNSPTHYSADFKFYNGWDLNDEVNPANVDWTKYSESHFPFTVVQQPGPKNALGLAKFIMPNDLSIYMHDTPTDYLFERNERAFSHGCIRLEKPDVLAEYFLRDQQGWDMAAIKKAMNNDKPIRVDLTHAYPVYLIYLTAFVDELGLVNFREDIYGYDLEQIQKLKKQKISL